MLNFQWLKRYTPRNLFARALLILFVPVIGVQLVAAGVFIQRHYEGVTAQMTSSVAQELSYVITVVETAETADAARAALQDLSELLGLSLYLAPEDSLPDTRLSLRFWDVSGRALAETLDRYIEQPLAINLTVIDKIVKVDIETQAGLLTALLPQRRMIASNPHLLLSWMIGTALILVTISVLFLRNQIRPITDLAHAAEAFGKGQSYPYRPRGADEVRRAGAAFLAMRTRIERHLEQRTAMLSGVSHDLRTPLTRMRLALAMAPPSAETAELTHDVDEMEQMLNAFLAFARGEGEEEMIQTNLRTMLIEIARGAERNGTVIRLHLPDDVEPMRLRALAVRRAVTNLVINAGRYGTQVSLGLQVTPHAASIIVEDNGPGIPEAEREMALRPFSRLDKSRNQNAGGGVGLGLTIALDIARSHGGELRLSDSAELGGLKAVLHLPR